MLSNWGFENLDRKWLLQQERPFFLYSQGQILANIHECRNALSKTGNWSECKIRYSCKANPNAHLLKLISDHVDGFDVSSALELQMLKTIGIASDRITLSGPGKTDEALRLACEWQIYAVHIESKAELEVLRRFRGDQAFPQICLRISSPGAEESKLAWTEKELRKTLQQEVEQTFAGIHCYLGRESFSTEKLSSVLETASRWMKEYPHAFIASPRFHVGPGVPALDDWSGFNASQKLTQSGAIDFELGRALVSTAGIYAAAVLSVKRSYQSRNIVILDGGIQHLGSPLMSMHHPNGADGGAHRSFLVRDGAVLKNASPTQVALFGSLCLWHDCLHPSLDVPADIRRGDWLYFTGCGAYGLTAAVPHFIGEDLPSEYLLEPGNPIPKNITPSHFKSYHETFNGISEETLHV